MASDCPLGQDCASPGLARHISYVGRMANLEKENAARHGEESTKTHALRLALEAAGIK